MSFKIKYIKEKNRIMKYIKTFESFSINENSSDISGVLSVVDNELSKLSEEERNKIIDETKAVASKLGVSLEQLADPEFAVKAMVDEAENAEIPVEEGWAGDVWNWLKSKSSSFYRTLGRVIGFGGAITSFAAMISAIVIGGAERSSLALYLRDLTGIAELDRTEQAGIFLAAFAGILISVFAGVALSHKADQVEKRARYGEGF